MKAILQTTYGGPEQLQLADVPKPTITDNQVLIQIHATNVSSGDMRINALAIHPLLKPLLRLVFGWSGPRQPIRGVTAAGVIVETGSKVTRFQPQTKVYFINSMKAGCLAEYIALDQSAVMARTPDSMSFVDAAPLAFGAMTAYHYFNETKELNGKRVLVYGASGAVGSYAIQLAKYYGADVTAVCSTKNHPKMLELGADHVIDYQTTDFRAGTKQYDVIFDSVMKLTKRSCKAVLKPGGTYLSVKSPTKEESKRLEAINAIIDQGQLRTLIDTVYPLSQFKEAHIQTYSGHKVGNVIIEIIPKKKTA